MTPATAGRGIVFDIQGYALYDGPGIRSTIYLKDCPLRCFWCHNPESQVARPQVMHLADRCHAGGACLPACPEGLLGLVDGRLVRRAAGCTDCGACVGACPERAWELRGGEVTAADVVAQVLADRAFFAHSGGGVTLSGGEPTSQPAFALAILHRLQQAGVHTALETCGSFAGDLLDELLTVVDLFLFDLKHLDDRAHRQGTGASNRQILDNFAAIVRRAGSDRIVPRIPLIPGFNTDPADLERTLAFLTRVGYAGEVHLMPHHGWARAKYGALGRAEDYRDAGELPEAALAGIEALVAGAGFTPVRYGES